MLNGLSGGAGATVSKVQAEGAAEQSPPDALRRKSQWIILPAPQAVLDMAIEISEQGYAALVEQINHAALDPSGWADVLHGLATATDCIAAGLTIENPFDGTGDPIDYFGFDPEHVAKTWHHYLPMNPLFAIGSRLQPGVIVTNGMVCPVETFRKTEFYDGWARPQGICCPITLVLHRSGASYIPLTLVRPDGRGDAEPEDFKFLARVAPLLKRAFAVTLRLGRLETRDLALDDALSRLSIGLLLVDARGRVAFANEIGERLLRQADVIETKGGVSSLLGDAALATAMAAASGPDGGDHGTGREMARPPSASRYDNAGDAW